MFNKVSIRCSRNLYRYFRIWSSRKNV